MWTGLVIAWQAFPEVIESFCEITKDPRDKANTGQNEFEHQDELHVHRDLLSSKYTRETSKQLYWR